MLNAVDIKTDARTSFRLRDVDGDFLPPPPDRGATQAGYDYYGANRLTKLTHPNVTNIANTYSYADGMRRATLYLG